jgi:hypothetical protein
MIVYFKNNDYGFEHWLRDTPNGYVFNDFSGPNLREKLLHRADCRLIRNPGSISKTCIRKVCSPNLFELADWIDKSRGPEGEGYTPCPCCEPFLTESDEDDDLKMPVAVWL